MDNADRAMLALSVVLYKIYRDAKKESRQKAIKYLSAFAVIDLLMRGRLKREEITKAEYQAWKQRTVFSGDKWKKNQREISNILYRANQDANAVVEARRLKVFAESANHTLYEFEAATGVRTKVPFLTEKAAQNIVDKEPKKLPKRKVNEKRDISWNDRNVSNAVTQSIIEGESVPECANRIAEITGSMNEKAMLRYARTAMCGAQSAGTLESLQEQIDAGINVQKQWIATLDSKTRDSHQYLDSQVQDVDKPFKSLLGEIMYPGDPSAEAADIFNCRCAIKGYYPEYADIINRKRRDNETGEIIGDVTYKEWKEAKEQRLIHQVGKIDKTMYKDIATDITTDEVIITDERIVHCNKHNGAYDKYNKYMASVISDPDYVFEDKKPNSAILTRKIIENDTVLELILRLHVLEDDPLYKNSVISYWDINEKTLERYLRNKKVVYKRPGL